MNELEFLVETIREQSIRGCRVGMEQQSAFALLGPELGREFRGKTLMVDFEGCCEGEMLLVTFRAGVVEAVMQDLVTGVALPVLSGAIACELSESPSQRVGAVSLECVDGVVVAVALV